VLRLTYSNCFEELCAALCEDLATARRKGRNDIFTPTRILVPNHHVTAYLKLAVAQRMGIAANLAFQFMTSFIADCAPASRGDLRVLDIPQLHGLLLAVLDDEELLAEDDLAPVRAYLHGAGTERDAVDLRRFQLAEKLASLFSDYRLSRPELVRAWPGGLALQDTREAATEVWQRRLWQAIFDPERGLLGRIARDTGVRWVFGPDLFDEVLVKDMDVPRHLYVIGFSYMPWAHHKVLALLARFVSVHVYALNPCMEFWEDLHAGWETRLAGRQLKKRGQDAVQLSFEDLDDTPALRLWGRPGRENVRILDELTQCDFTARFLDPAEARVAAPGPAGGDGDGSDHGGAAPAQGDHGGAGHTGRLSMLAALQRDVLFRHPARHTPDPEVDPDDRSIRILGCPSIQRELEIIGNEIWALMARDASLRFNDIAVLVSRADQELYQAHIPAVFNELHQIPHHFADVPLRSESRMIEGLELLIDLPFGRFTRPELLRILTHPALLARYPDVDPNDWVHWSERLGIMHGADHGDHEGTYIERDLYNWQQGIRRLALGAFMAGERSGESRPFRLGDSAYLPEELPADLLPSAARFSLVARSLISDARYCRTAVKPLAQWRIFFDLLVSSYLAPQSPEDERNLAACREAIATLAAADLDGRPVPYRIPCELLRMKLVDMRGESGELLAQGVTVAPLLPMRPIPYRVIFLAGLGEGHFPASERESPLDLRLARRRRGDVSPRERDRYLFLETLLSARDRIYLSYVSRDDQTGESLQPSPVVLELAHMLRRGYAHEDGAERIAVDHPLRRYDPRYFPALFRPPAGDAGGPEDSTADGTADSTADRPENRAEAPLVSVAPAAHRQAHVLALRRDLERMLREHGHDMPTMDELRQALSAPRFAALRAHLGWAELTPSSTQVESEEDTIAISLAMVRRFLESPLQAWAAAVLRLRESEMEDLVARADEAFATPVAPMVGLLRDVFDAHLGAGEQSFEALVARYRQRAQHLELSGHGPTGVFSEIDQERHLAILERWHAHLCALGGEGERFAMVSFGRAREHADAGELLPPLALTVELGEPGARRPVRVELFGRTDPLGGADIGSLIASHRPTEHPRYLLRGFLDHLALSAAGRATGEHVTTVITTGDHVSQYRLAPWTADEARAYLAALIADLLDGQHEYLLPCEAVFTFRDKPDRPIAAVIEGLKSQGRGFSCLYGPVSQIDHLDAPRDAEAVIERRFGPLFQRLTPIEREKSSP
jgi:exodeoxyribonuclease V gamma subunit